MKTLSAYRTKAHEKAGDVHVLHARFWLCCRILDEEHETRESCTSWSSTEVLGPALATLLITRGEDTETMMLACARFGRDADTICRVAGGLAGALNGADSIPAEWRETVLARNAWLRERLPGQADRLTALVARRAERAAHTAKGLTAGGGLG